MIYIVCGFMRTGTSLMMRALETGGMKAVYSQNKDSRMDSKHGAEVNRDGYYEMELEDYHADGYPSQFDGKMFKCLYGGILYLPPVRNYRIVFMRRPADQIKKSLLKAFGYRHTLVDDNKTFQKEMSRIVSCLRDRRAVRSVTEIWMKDLVQHPARELARVKNDHWPIDVSKAAEIPDVNKMRFR